MITAIDRLSINLNKCIQIFKVLFYILLQYPTALAMQQATLHELASEMSKCESRRSGDWFLNKACQCKDVAERNPFQHEVYASQLINLRMYIQMIC